MVIMPRLNYAKLQYKKETRTVETVVTNGFYEPVSSNDEYKRSYRGYHTYDYFGPTVRRHEPVVENEKETD